MPQKFKDPTVSEQSSVSATNDTGQMRFRDPTVSEPVVPTAQKKEQSFIGGLAQKGLQGATFGLADEAQAGVAASIMALNSDLSFKESYKIALDDLRQESKGFSDENPKAAFAAELAGGLATGGVGAGALKSVALPTATKLAAGGAGFGAASGFGFSEADNATDLAIDTLQGAGTGAAFGVVAPVAVNLAGKAGAGILNKVDDVFRTPETRAIRRIKNAMDADDISALGATRKKASLGDQAAIVDLSGKNTLELGEDIIQNSSKAANRADKFLTKRAGQHRERIIQSVKGGVSKKADNMQETVDDITQAMKAKAGPLYENAYSSGITETQTLKALREGNESVKSALKKGLKLMQRDSDLPDKYKLADIDSPNIILWDYAKRALGDKAIKTKGGNERRIFQRLEFKIKKELVGQNKDYKDALKVWSDSSENLDALELGRSIFKDAKKGNPLSEKQFKSMSESAQEMYRLGVGNELIRIANTANDTLEGVSTSLYAKVFGSPAQRDAIKRVLGDKQFKQFSRELNAERVFSNNRNRISKGSQTGRRLQGKGAVDQAEEIATGGIYRNAFEALRRATNRVIQDPAVDKEVARRVFTNDLKTIQDTLNKIKVGKATPAWKNAVESMTPKQFGRWIKVERNKKLLSQTLANASGIQAGKLSSEKSDNSQTNSEL